MAAVKKGLSADSNDIHYPDCKFMVHCFGDFFYCFFIVFNNQYLLIILNSPNVTIVYTSKSHQAEKKLELFFLKRFLKLSPQFLQVLLILVNTAYFQAALCGVFCAPHPFV